MVSTTTTLKYAGVLFIILLALIYGIAIGKTIGSRANKPIACLNETRIINQTIYRTVYVPVNASPPQVVVNVMPQTSNYTITKDEDDGRYVTNILIPEVREEVRWENDNPPSRLSGIPNLSTRLNRIHEAADSGNISYCSRLDLTILKDVCFAQIAAASRKNTYCDSVKDQDYREFCLQYYNKSHCLIEGYVRNTVSRRLYSSVKVKVDSRYNHYQTLTTLSGFYRIPVKVENEAYNITVTVGEVNASGQAFCKRGEISNIDLML